MSKWKLIIWAGLKDFLKFVIVTTLAMLVLVVLFNGILEVMR